MNRFVNAALIASFALTSGMAAADASSPFPYTPPENGGDPALVVGPEQPHGDTVGRSDASSFPAATLPENGGDPAWVAGPTFKQLHHATVGQADGSSFPSGVDENGGVEPESRGYASRQPDTRTARASDAADSERPTMKNGG